MYLSEINYYLCINTMLIYIFVSNTAATVVTFAFLYIFAATSRKKFMINTSWDMREIAVIVWYRVETSNKTL